MPTESSIERSLREMHAPRVEPPSPTAESEAAVLRAWGAASR